MLAYHIGICVLLCIAAAAYFKFFHKKKPATDKDQMVRDFMRLTWDCQQQICAATTHEELLAAEYEVDWIAQTFHGQISDSALEARVRIMVRSLISKRNDLKLTA